MGALVVAHVDEFLGFLHAQESGLDHGGRFTHKGHHRAVGCRSGIDINHFDASHLLDFIGNLVDDFHIAPFTEIWDAFDYLLHIFLFFSFQFDYSPFRMVRSTLFSP